MTPEASLDYLYSLQKFGIKLGLENVRQLLERLGNPEKSFRCVHVAGTNGKGSVSVLLAETLAHAGYRVGLYTSPHLHCFTERIRIDGKPLAMDQLPRLVREIQSVSEGLAPTFFEAATVLALLVFRESKVDIAVLETGMGGRLDATNAVVPLLCLITPISLDHQEYLGGTLPEIAAEKAGIIKPGIPVVCGLQDAIVSDVISVTAQRCGAPVWHAGQDYSWGGSHDNLWFRAEAAEIHGLMCPLAGNHQLANFAHAIAGAVCLRQSGMIISDLAIRRAGETACWPGRLEWWGDTVLLDGAHNAAGASALAHYLANSVKRPVRLVTALSGQRRAEDVLRPLAGMLRTVYAAQVPEVTGVSAEDLAAWAQSSGIPARTFAEAREAFTTARHDRLAGEVVVVAGSLYLVAAVRTLLIQMSGQDERKGCARLRPGA